MRAVAAIAAGLVVFVVVLVVIGSTIGGADTPAPSLAAASLAASSSVSPAGSPTTSAVSQATRAEIVASLAARSIGVEDARAPYRPPESPLLQSAPRLVVEAFLPADPTAGQIVVYEFPSVADAGSAGREMARFIASGPGRVNFTPDSLFVLRQLGETLIFYTYAPGSLAEPAAAAAVAEALSTIGSEVPITG